MLHILGSAAALKATLLRFSPWTPLVYFLLQTAQVVIAPIPGGATTLIGGALFGWLKGFLLSGSAAMLGSFLAFGLGKRFGRPFVMRFRDRKWVARLEALDEAKLDRLLFFVFLCPGFPDDFICLASGLTKIPFRRFAWICALGRLPGFFLIALIGAGIMKNDPVQLALLLAAYGGVTLGLYYLRKHIAAAIDRRPHPDASHERSSHENHSRR